MAMFKIYGSVTKPGPGVAKGEKRKTGLPRLGELIARDFRSLMLIGAIQVLVFLPVWLLYMAAFYFGAQGFEAGFYTCFGGILLYGLVYGPAHTACVYAISKSLRDEPQYPLHEWGKVFKGSFRQTAVFGMVYTGACAFQVLNIDAALVAGQAADLSGLIPTVLSTLLFHMIVQYFFLQAAYIDLPVIELLKNSFFFCFKTIPRSLASAALALAFFMVVFLFLPFSLLVALLFGAGLLMLVQLFLVFGIVDKTFGIEKEYRERNAEVAAQ